MKIKFNLLYVLVVADTCLFSFSEIKSELDVSFNYLFMNLYLKIAHVEIILFR